jgi:hypothetical protein
MWRTFSVFSRTTNSLIAVASMPSSSQAALGSAMKRALKTGSTHARAMSLAPLAGERAS